MVTTPWSSGCFHRWWCRSVGGYSSGALLAYAIAQRFAEQDEPVDFIGMLDCEHHTKDHDPESPEAKARYLFLSELTEVIEEQAFGEQEDVRQVLRQLADDLPRTPLDELVARYEHNDLLSALARKQHTSVRQIANTYLRIAQFHKLWPSYAARTLPAPLRLHAFYATEGTPPPHPMGWQELLPLDQIVVVPVPGTHASLIKPPHIEHVGRTVSTALREPGDARSTDPSQRSGDHTATRAGEWDRTGVNAHIDDAQLRSDPQITS